MEEEYEVALKPQAVMIAFPYQGHINPFVHLAIKLASNGFSITFVHTQYIHHLISESRQELDDVFSDFRASGLDIRYATISDGFPLDYDRKANFPEFARSLFEDFPSRVDEFVGNMFEERRDPSTVRVMVADTIATWPRFIAEKYDMVNVSFWTGPALVFALNCSMDLLARNGHFPPSGDSREHLIDYIPGVDPIKAKDLISHLLEAPTTIAHKILFKVFEDVKKADFVLHNTVQELEPRTLSALSELNPTYAVGPIGSSTKINVSTSLLSEIDCTVWLNSKPPGSVLYVSFGSVARTPGQVIKEVAKGLDLSMVHFIWVIREGLVAGEAKIFPIGFEENVKERGLIVPWCDQTAVLSHPAVGGFLTHCGWNSILESIWAGVPMLCYPVTYDQPTNRKLVVDDWKVGINLCDDDVAPLDARHVASKIKILMNRERSVGGLRHTMERLSDTVRRALDEDGSSTKNFDRFLKDFKYKVKRHRSKNKF
nr:UDP-glycosyltransferase 2 [Andrographis paniculata]